MAKYRMRVKRFIVGTYNAILDVIRNSPIQTAEEVIEQEMNSYVNEREIGKFVLTSYWDMELSKKIMIESARREMFPADTVTAILSEYFGLTDKPKIFGPKVINGKRFELRKVLDN